MGDDTGDASEAAPTRTSSVPVAGTASQEGTRGRQFNNFGGSQRTVEGHSFEASRDLYIETTEEDQLFKACLESLSFSHMDARQHDISQALPDTCDWFFQTTEFQEWQDRTDISHHNGVLWIKGKPGAGKSTLMKHVLAHCLKVFENHVVAAHFFNARGDPTEKSPLGMLRSLICQLVELNHAYRGRFLALFRKKQQRHGRKPWEWRDAELRDFLRSGLREIPATPVLLLVDALDECSEPGVRSVVELLEELSIDAAATSNVLRICLSSRHFPRIGMRLRQELVIEKVPEHDRDIKIYVRDKLAKQDGAIEQGICAKASGIFMWVVLVVAILNKAYDEGKVEAMHRKLEEMPGELEELFESLLSDDMPDKQETLLMLQFVLLAERSLAPPELFFAVRAESNPGGLDAWDKSAISDEDIKRRIICASRGLIEVRDRSAAVQFIHTTVKDFLFRNQRLQRLDPSLEANPIGISHDRLCICCLSCLKRNASIPMGLAPCDSNRSRFPFLEYAAVNILGHAEEAEKMGVSQDGVIQALRKGHCAFGWLTSLHSMIISHPTTIRDGGALLLVLSAWRGYSGLVNRILATGLDVEAPRKVFATALHAATLQGHLEVMNLLLAQGADVNALGGLYGTALQAASFEGSDAPAALLIARGADVNVQGGLFGTALQAASFVGNDALEALLMARGADVNVQCGLLGTALQAASFQGNYALAARLIARGADVNVQGGLLGNALQTASFRGWEKIVTLLLEQGGNINAQGGPLGTALQAAAAGGHRKVVVRLLAAKADVNAQCGFFGSALHAAAANREHRQEIEALLLEKGADASVEVGPYGFALATATRLFEGEHGFHGQDQLVSTALQAVVLTEAHGISQAAIARVERQYDNKAWGEPFGTPFYAALASRRNGLS
ncbi:Ankyrin repeat-containing domain protein [Moelleriella libera RCEF 2490]|uniref:Ankyrin repeat-containing domain protein n=1 Tax=Moelleriella libera RCEF 2490 TaxID=1081109 RepID=A0A167W7P6_9HYPO|nr:Ankyrin repeat-containing domain protein [Moelleriella libera RCEF 2490]